MSDGLLDGLFGDPRTDELLDDRALLAAMLEVERALAQAEADVRLIPAEAAADVAAACDPARFDLGSLGRAAEGAGNPVASLVHELAAAVPSRSRPWVHYGATSQDVLDTALMLLATRAGEQVLGCLAGCADAAAELADRHRATIMVGRTLGQHAVPTTFGLVASGWLIALDESRGDLDVAVHVRPAVSLGGAAGTLAGLGDRALDVVSGLGRRLRLNVPVLPWHTNRQRVLGLANALGAVSAALGKVALDVTMLARTEVGELAEGDPDRGGSSAMPHKRNPVDAVLVTAGTRRVPGLVATLLAAAAQEEQRASGAWHSEWQPFRELFSLVGGAACRTSRMLAGLEVRPGRMQHNLDSTHGLVMAESVAYRLMPALGRTDAQRLTSRCCAEAVRRGVPLRDVLLSEPAVTAVLDEAAVTQSLDPRSWLGSAETLVDRALAAHRAIG